MHGSVMLAILLALYHHLTSTSALLTCGDYQHKIVVDAATGNDSVCMVQPNVPCRTLAYALTNKTLSNVCIVLRGKQEMQTVVSVSGAYKMLLTSNTTNTEVNCNNIGGLAFYDSSNLSFYNITFDSCGAWRNSTCMPYNYKGQLISPLLSSALYFDQCLDVGLYYSYVVNSQGYGIVMYDVGSNVTLDHVRVRHSQSVSYLQPNGTVLKGHASGGGIYLEYTYNRTNNPMYYSNNFIHIRNSLFYRNLAEYIYSVPTEGYLLNHVPFGRGGGLTIFFRGNATNNTVLVECSRFSLNSALWGGGVFIEHHDYSLANNVSIICSPLCDSPCSIDNNQASYAGGGIRLGSCRPSFLVPSVSKLVHCSIMSNTAYYGGGLSLYRYTDYMKTEEATFLVSCTISKNLALEASALAAELSALFVLSSSIDNNGCNFVENYSCIGTVRLFRSTISFSALNLVSKNQYTALVLDSSQLLVLADSMLMMDSNSGDDGGAVALYGHSTVYLQKNAVINFSYNEATKRGGALFVDIPGPQESSFKTTQLNTYYCFIQFAPSRDQFSGSVNFTGNEAPENSGSAMHVTSLESCRVNDQLGVMDIFMWNNSFFYEKQSTPVIVTNPVRIYVIEDAWKNLYPGLYFKPYIELFDEREQLIGGTVQVTIDQANCTVYLETSFYVVSNENTIDIRIVQPGGEKICSFEVHIDVPTGPSIAQIIYPVTTQHCPFGFVKSDGLCKCDYQNLEKGIVDCNGTDVDILVGKWASLSEGTTYICPDQYCDFHLHSDTDQSLYFQLNKTHQCKEHRDQSSTLCGLCETNKSVPLFGETCQNCQDKSWWWIWILLTCFIIIFALVLAVMVLNLDALAAYLNAFLYSCQVTGLLITSNQQMDVFLKFMINTISMTGTGGTFQGVCFINGLDNLSKVAINYVFPVFTALIIVVICLVVSRNSDRKLFRLFSEKCCFRSFAIISMYIYSDFARITFQLLHPVTINHRLHLFIQGSELFFHGRHLYFGILALVVFVVVVVGGPLLLLFTRFFYQTCGQMIRLKGIFDAFKTCYKSEPDRQHFAAFYFICRAVLWAVYIFKTRDSLQMTLLSLTCVVVLMVFLFSQPYESNRLNYFDTVLLTNMTVISILSAGKFRTLSDDTSRALGIVIHVLMYVPFALLGFKILHEIFIRVKVCRSIPDRVNHRQERHPIPARVRPDLEDHIHYRRM